MKVDSLGGIERAPDSLALVAGTGALLAMLGNPFFGKMSDRTSSQLGIRRPWMVIGLVGGSLGILIVALAPASRWSSSDDASPRHGRRSSVLHRAGDRADRPGGRRRQLRRAVRGGRVCAIVGAVAILPVKRVR